MPVIKNLEEFKECEKIREELVGLSSSIINIINKIHSPRIQSLCSINEEVKNHLNHIKQSICKEEREYYHSIMEYQKNHNHNWKAIYREDGETHGVCQGCGQHEWRESRNCPY